MMTRFPNLNYAVAAIAALVTISLPAAAQDSIDLDELFGELRSATPESHERIERQIWSQWSKSGSPAMDFLLKRGREALEAGDVDAAIEHFTALTDHAPDFAEGWNGRATAYFQKGLYGPSIEDIGRALTLNPRHFGAMSGLALMFEEFGMKTEALDIYRRIADLNPLQDNVQDAIERLEKETGGQTL